MRYNAWLVAKGHTQKEVTDYTEIFSPIIMYTTIKVMLTFVAYYDQELEQLDVKTDFLHDDLDEKIFMN